MGLFFEVQVPVNAQAAIESTVAHPTLAPSDKAIAALAAAKPKITVHGNRLGWGLVLLFLFVTAGSVAEMHDLAKSTDGFWDLAKTLGTGLLAYFSGEGIGAVSAAHPKN